MVNVCILVLQYTQCYIEIMLNLSYCIEINYAYVCQPEKSDYMESINVTDLCYF